MDTLIPNEVPISIKILLSSNERFFLTTETRCHPKAVIRSAIMHFQVMNVSYFLQCTSFSFSSHSEKTFSTSQKQVVLLKDHVFHGLNNALSRGATFQTKFIAGKVPHNQADRIYN
jgi:hypothetical protein